MVTVLGVPSVHELCCHRSVDFLNPKWLREPRQVGYSWIYIANHSPLWFISDPPNYWGSQNLHSIPVDYIPIIRYTDKVSLRLSTNMLRICGYPPVDISYYIPDKYPIIRSLPFFWLLISLINLMWFSCPILPPMPLSAIAAWELHILELGQRCIQLRLIGLLLLLPLASELLKQKRHGLCVCANFAMGNIHIISTKTCKYT